MSEKLTLYGCPNSRSLRVAWALEEAGADYDYRLVDLFRGEGRQAAYLAINPAGKVPVLDTPDGRLTESGAILLWIAERYPAAGLLPGPASPAERAGCLQWVMFVLTELEQPLWTIAKHRFALPEEHRVAGIERTATWEFGRAAALLAGHLGTREYIGDSFGVADILAGHTLAWAQSARVDSGSPLLDEYLARQVRRPAVQQALQSEARLKGS